MAQAVSANYNISEVNKSYSMGGSLKNSAKTFWSEMRTLMKDFARRDEGMVIDGVYIEADQKYGILGATLMGEKTNELERFMESQLANFNILADMEKQIRNMI